ncbi:LysR substrate-binding domain-containing protein [Serratia sp. DD3]|uniref:LysR substrate-binding domain-containing protein n=1 Tax=Serratia sp. DD3 TaxID=1410619 RepID=UPI0003C4FC30|nr:LysR substrate-binding domain-containing protein [Serratia sp. DD3]KEY57691.1 HTH-type transcriptional regulator DmlR [Serratia sp. DD3]
MDKLTAMATFITVVDSGNFTRAAAMLNLPKARVSQRVADLESALGVRLLHRTTRVLNLTEDGRAYLEQCRHILREIDELEDSLKGTTRVPEGNLRVDALASIARWVIAPHLHKFQKMYPNITLRFGSSDRISHLLEEGIDCAIRGGKLENSSMIARHVADVYLGLYAAPAFLKSEKPIRAPEDLICQPRLSWFGSREGERFVWQLAQGVHQATLPEPDTMLFDDPNVALTACMAGAGICPAAPFAVESYVRNGLLVPVLPEWHFKPRPIHIIYPSKKHLSARIRCFVDWSLELMQQNNSLHLTPIELTRNLD